MAKKRKTNAERGLMKDTQSLLGVGVLTGVGASVVTGIGGNAAGLTNVSRHFGTLGSLVGTKAVIKATQRLKPKKKGTKFKKEFGYFI